MGTNPAGTGGAVWRGIAEAAETGTFERLGGTAELGIADLSRPLVDVDIDLDDGGDGVALRWEGIEPAAGAFGSGAAGTDRIDGRFHGPGHGEAFGTFDTGGVCRRLRREAGAVAEPVRGLVWRDEMVGIGVNCPDVVG